MYLECCVERWMAPVQMRGQPIRAFLSDKSAHQLLKTKRTYTLASSFSAASEAGILELFFVLRTSMKVATK